MIATQSKLRDTCQLSNHHLTEMIQQDDTIFTLLKSDQIKSNQMKFIEMNQIKVSFIIFLFNISYSLINLF